MRCQSLSSAMLVLTLIACNKKSQDLNSADLPNDRVTIDTAGKDAAAAGTGDASEVQSFTLSASCTDKQFSLQITQGADVKNLRLDKLEQCEALVKVLDKITLPNGKTEETLNGGPNISANCVEGKFDLKASQAESTTSTVTLFGLNSQLCRELRNLVNSAQL